MNLPLRWQKLCKLATPKWDGLLLKVDQHLGVDPYPALSENWVPQYPSYLEQIWASPPTPSVEPAPSTWPGCLYPQMDCVFLGAGKRLKGYDGFAKILTSWCLIYQELGIIYNNLLYIHIYIITIDNHPIPPVPTKHHQETSPNRFPAPLCRRSSAYGMFIELSNILNYPLVNVYITVENHHF